MSSGFVGGKLKLKGGDPKGISKKKKKKSTDAAVLALTTAGEAAAEGGAAAEGAQAGSSAEPVKTKDGYILPAPSANEDRRTEAQKRHDERVRKLEEERLRKMATKGYRDRVKDFNEHLASLSEHHDIPKVGWKMRGGDGGLSGAAQPFMLTPVVPCLLSSVGGTWLKPWACQSAAESSRLQASPPCSWAVVAAGPAEGACGNLTFTVTVFLSIHETTRYIRCRTQTFRESFPRPVSRWFRL